MRTERGTDTETPTHGFPAIDSLSKCLPQSELGQAETRSPSRSVIGTQQNKQHGLSSAAFPHASAGTGIRSRVAGIQSGSWFVDT